MNLQQTRIEWNGQDNGQLRGGGLRVAGGQAQVAISNGTVIRRNRAFEGDQIYVDTAFTTLWCLLLSSVTYTLPTPLGHYLIITDRSDFYDTLDGDCGCALPV